MVQIIFDTDLGIAGDAEIEVSYLFNPTLSHIDGPIFPYEEEVEIKEFYLKINDGPEKLYTYEDRVLNKDENSMTFFGVKEKL